MKKNILLFGIMLVILASFVSAIDFDINYTIINKTDYVTTHPFDNMEIVQLRYEPYPANPGEYVTLWIKAQNTGNRHTKNATFVLVPEYPFSLDPNENPERRFGVLNSEPIVLKYKMRVDKDAIEDTNEVKIRYTFDEIEWFSKTMEIEVVNVQTDFDLVIQEISGSDVSIAIANTGENIAYSTIVRIPDQEGYQAVGTNGQMVGNLEDGDYTLVGFSIESKGRDNNMPLEVQIDYTDMIGERRSIMKEMQFNYGTSLPAGNFTGRSSMFGNMTGTRAFAGRMQVTQAYYQTWWFWAIIFIISYGAWKGYKALKRHRQEKEEKRSKK